MLLTVTGLGLALGALVHPALGADKVFGFYHPMRDPGARHIAPILNANALSGYLNISICLLFAITAGLSGCVSAANTGYYGQTPQTYNLTVTATSGNLSRSTYLTLTVQ